LIKDRIQNLRPTAIQKSRSVKSFKDNESCKSSCGHCELERSQSRIAREAFEKAMDINVYLLNELSNLSMNEEIKQKSEIQNMYHTFT